MSEEARNSNILPIVEFFRQIDHAFGPILQKLTEWSVTSAPYAQKYLVWNRCVEMSKKADWLSFRSIPPQFFLDCPDDPEILNQSLRDYYLEHWNEIRGEIESSIIRCNIDEEARSTVREALDAHEKQLYRCVIRVLFPEIERTIGARSTKSKKILDHLIPTRGLEDVIAKGVYDYVLFDQFTNHSYKFVPRNDLSRFANNHVPNRHAAVHGFVPYCTHKHSMNMLILVDYVFRILP